MLRCGLLGETLGHSYSPMIHHELGEYDYRLFEVPKEDLDAFLCPGRWDGLNVTIPYKKAVVPYCAELSEAAERLQSVNTLVHRPDGSIQKRVLRNYRAQSFPAISLILKTGKMRKHQQTAKA